jgi:hypothetical protein
MDVDLVLLWQSTGHLVQGALKLAQPKADAENPNRSM